MRDKLVQEFQFKESFRLASQIYSELVDILNDMLPNDDYIFDSCFEKFIEKISRPHKITLLHDYISFIHEDSMGYIIDKGDSDDVIEILQETMDNYSLSYPEYTDEDMIDFETKRRYLYEIEKIYYQLTPIITQEVFTLLFADKKLLRTFNDYIGDRVDKLKLAEYPEILEKDGVVKRCDYLPSWLKKGVFFRDKGICQLCGKDISGTLKIDDVHYDHIIPLEQGGTNDPTNYQLLCGQCNLSKGARNCDTKNLIQTYW